MAHDIEQVNGTAFFADSRNDAWHQLGQKFGRTMTVAEAMDAAHLGGWNVRKTPLLIPADMDENGVYPEIEVPDQYGIVRTNPITGQRDYLGTAGNVWAPLQNEANAEFLQTLTDEFGANIETAGSLGNGRDVFITMKLPHTMEIAGVNGYVDKTEWYLAALNNHTGNSSFRVILSPVRIVCRNTQQWAIREAQSSWRVRHTATATQRTAEARNVLGITWKSVGLIDDEFRRMSEVLVTHQEAQTFADRLMETDKVDPKSLAATRRNGAAGQIIKLWSSSPTIAPIAGTRFALYNAVTEYVDHYQGVRGVGADATDTAKADARATRAIRDAEKSDSLKAQAFQLLRVA